MKTVYFDLDETLFHDGQVRPGARRTVRRLEDAGCAVHVFTAGEQHYQERQVEQFMPWFRGNVYSSRRSGIAPPGNRPWILVDNLPADHANTRRKVAQLSRRGGRGRVVKVDSWYGR